MNHRLPLTHLGVVVVGACLLSYGLAISLHWREFAALAIGFGLVLAIAVPYVTFGGQLRLDRRIEPSRIQVDGTARSVLTVTNTGRHKTSPRVIEDSFGDTPWQHDVRSLDRGESATSDDRLPSGRRGVFDIGPATIVKTDPLGILRRSLGRVEVSQLWVHPRTVALASLRSGFAKDLEGPTSDTSPAGDVSFHTIREYVHGDDVRHVHWLSTAKTGTLMVRHYVDNRRPYLGVLVDADPRHLSPDGFERALEVAASHLRSADLDGRPVAVVVGDQEVMTPTSPIDTEGALDRLCLSSLGDRGQSANGPGPGPDRRNGRADGPTSLADRARRLRLVAPEVSALLIVTGLRSAPELLEVVDEARRHGKVVVTRIVPHDTEPIVVPGSRVIDCQDVDSFAVTWQRVVG